MTRKRMRSLSARLMAAALACFVGLAPVARALDGNVSVQGGRSAVRIGGIPGGSCTGFIINFNVIVTAGHCVTDYVKNNGTRSMNVTYTRDGTNFFCISGPSTSAGQCRSSTSLKWATPGTLTTDNPADNDLGYILFDSGWQNVTDSDFVGITTTTVRAGTSDQAFVYGRGGTVFDANDQRMRRAVTQIESVTASTLITRALQDAQGRKLNVWACNGDSGGPNLKFAFNFYWAQGVSSSISTPAPARCQDLQSRARYFRFTPRHITAINNAIQIYLTPGRSLCTDMSTIGWTDPGYYWCSFF